MKYNIEDVELRVTKMFRNAVVNEKPSVKYSDVLNKSHSSLSLFRKKRITLLIALCVILVLPTAGYAFTKISISELFTEMKLKLAHHEIDNSKPVAIVSGHEILVKDFVFNKANLELIWKLNDIKVNKTDMDLLTDMIKEQLLVQYALEKGYSVSNEDINSYISNLRNHLSQADVPKEMKEIMANRIKLSGLSEEDFWKSPDIINSYKDLLLKDKVGQKLQMDVVSYEKFKDELWSQNKDKIKIYKENLN